MTNSNPPNAHGAYVLQQKIAEMKAAEAKADALRNSYIRYVVLANAGGVAACLGIAGSLVGNKSPSLAISFPSMVFPMAIFLLGVISGALIVSLLGKQAMQMTEQLRDEAVVLLRNAGQLLATPKPVFSDLERKGMTISERTINVLGLVSQFAFVIGAIWGLVLFAIARVN